MRVPEKLIKGFIHVLPKLGSHLKFFLISIFAAEVLRESTQK